MVEYYDPDRAGGAGAPEPPGEVRVERDVPPDPATGGRPVPELIIVGLAVALIAAGAWATRGDIVLFGLQVVYPLASPLLAGAVAALLVRRALRRQRATLEAAIAPLYDELAALRAEVGDTSRR